MTSDARDLLEDKGRMGVEQAGRHWWSASGPGVARKFGLGPVGLGELEVALALAFGGFAEGALLPPAQAVHPLLPHLFQDRVDLRELLLLFLGLLADALHRAIAELLAAGVVLLVGHAEARAVIDGVVEGFGAHFLEL